MSNLILNIRFGEYHLQVTRFSDWRGWRYNFPITFRRNPYHAEARKLPGWKWLEIN